MKSLLHVAEKHGDPHKALLQIICQNGGIRISKIVEVFQAICDACFIQTSIPEQCTVAALSKALIKSINAVLAPMELKISVTTDYRFPDEQYLTMYSSSAGGKFSKLFTPDELELFQKWFNMMFVDARWRGELNGVEAINVEFDGRRRPLLAESFLKKLVEDNILVKLQDHNSYIFSSKSIMELDPRLRADAYDIPQCPVCSLLIVIQRFSHNCPKCETSIHNTCLYKMINLSNTAITCPGGNRCTQKFDKDTLEELDFDADLPESTNRVVEIRGNARRRQKEKEAEDDDDEEEEVDENMEEEEEDDA